MEKNQIQVFKNKEFGKLEVLVIGDKPYFPATECAKVLGYAEAQNAVRRHCQKDGCVKHTVIDRLGREQKMNFISEGNLYRLIIRSKLPVAEQFERWVFDEVLPTIRKHGGYIVDELLDKLAESEEKSKNFMNALQKERRERKAERKSFEKERDSLAERCDDIVKSFGSITEKIDEIEGDMMLIAPKAEYCDVILQCENSIPVSIIAKDYGFTAASFNKLLNTIGVQHKIRGTWLLYKKYCNLGYTESVTYRISEKKCRVHTYWTQRGRRMIYDVLKLYGVLPNCERFGSC